MQTAHRSRPARAILSLLAGGVTLAGIACNENKPAAQSANDAPPPIARPMLPSNAPAGGGIPPTAPPVATSGTPEQARKPAEVRQPTQALPNVPADAQWTIYCFSVKGLDHVEGANAARDGLVRKTGRADWYVIHGREESNIYFGFYRAVEPKNPKTAADVTRARADLRMVADVPDVRGDKPFAHSVFVSLESPDPTASAELNLFNVDRALKPSDPKRAYWSLQVMAFRGDALRKEAAVQAVKDLRERGVEAYYYHGEAVSSVCVGHWPADAVKDQSRTAQLKDVANAPAQGNLVVSSDPIDDNLRARNIDGRSTVAVAPKLEVLDPSMKAMMLKFPNHAVNYEIGQKTGQDGSRVLDPSFLVTIPRAKGNGLYDSDEPADRQARTAGVADRQRGATMLSPLRDRTVGAADVRPARNAQQ